MKFNEEKSTLTYCGRGCSINISAKCTAVFPTVRRKIKLVNVAIFRKQFCRPELFLMVPISIRTIFCSYRPQRSWAKVIFSEVCVKNSVHGGGVWVWSRGVSNFLGEEGFSILGGVLHFWGVLQIFGGSPIFRGVSNFSGGRGVSNFSGGKGGLQFFRGSPNFFFLFFSISFPQRNSFWDAPTPPPGDGQCAAGTHPTGMHSCFI